jgi:hypothetical protein
MTVGEDFSVKGSRIMGALVPTIPTFLDAADLATTASDADLWWERGLVGVWGSSMYSGGMTPPGGAVDGGCDDLERPECASDGDANTRDLSDGSRPRRDEWVVEEDKGLPETAEGGLDLLAGLWWTWESETAAGVRRVCAAAWWAGRRKAGGSVGGESGSLDE